MLTRKLKLKLKKSQEIKLIEWCDICLGVYNWGIRQIKLNSENKIYLSKFDLNNLTTGCCKRIGIHSQVIQSILEQSYNAWDRCFKKYQKNQNLKE